VIAAALYVAAALVAIATAVILVRHRRRRRAELARKHRRIATAIHELPDDLVQPDPDWLQAALDAWDWSRWFSARAAVLEAAERGAITVRGRDTILRAMDTGRGPGDDSTMPRAVWPLPPRRTRGVA
jgi:hypothetical protein